MQPFRQDPTSYKPEVGERNSRANLDFGKKNEEKEAWKEPATQPGQQRNAGIGGRTTSARQYRQSLVLFVRRAILLD